MFQALAAGFESQLEVFLSKEVLSRCQIAAGLVVVHVNTIIYFLIYFISYNIIIIIIRQVSYCSLSDLFWSPALKHKI